MASWPLGLSPPLLRVLQDGAPLRGRGWAPPLGRLALHAGRLRLLALRPRRPALSADARPQDAPAAQARPRPRPRLPPAPGFRLWAARPEV